MPNSILIVDDSSSMRQTVGMALKRAGKDAGRAVKPFQLQALLDAVAKLIQP